ncbi:hypothetical protein JOC36_000098 [Weissella uvarum]|uniref:hypothetical protein n=1 Tax=Weissella uvarum TaxID=1479233 RepID=UPI00195FA790|nr:hypothetical protein [Weissella uvarum]MBM7616565.1 hypothetical protein [Weissella uvarum]MCM0594975.1 hypothetical protein [Weissella uvarum]
MAIEATYYIDQVYETIEATLRTALEHLLLNAARNGQFGVVIEESPELFDQLRRYNFFTMPMGFQLDATNDGPEHVQTILHWSDISKQHASLVNDLVAISIENFPEKLDDAETVIYLNIKAQLDEHDFVKSSEVIFEDAAADFIKQHVDYFKAVGMRIRNGIKEVDIDEGQTATDQQVLALTIY